MIDHGAVREAIRDVAVAAIGDAATVYHLPPTGTLQLPAVLIGLPEWEQTRHDLAAGYLDKTTFPVAVVVGRGVDDAQVLVDLEGLWPALVEAINHEINEGTGFDHCAEAANVNRAYADPITIAGQTYPAQTIEIDFY